MKRLLSILFLFLFLSLPVLHSEAADVKGAWDLLGTTLSLLSNDTERRTNYIPKEKPILLPNVSIDDAQKAIIGRLSPKYWHVRNDSQFSLDLYRVQIDNGYLLKNYLRDEHGNLLYEDDSSVISVEQRIHFDFIEQNNGTLLSYTVNVTTNPNRIDEKSDYYQGNLSLYVKDILKELFIGSSSYNIKYSIKKDYVKISDTSQTYYTNLTKLGSNRKIVKINDKNISEYTKANLKNLLENCTQEQIKLETNDTMGRQTYYINRTYTEPTYKQYL